MYESLLDLCSISQMSQTWGHKNYFANERNCALLSKHVLKKLIYNHEPKIVF